MNRRDFLSRFVATAAGAAVAHTLDLDRLLWVPGERTIFLPSVPVAGEPLAMGDLVWCDGMRWRRCTGEQRIDGVAAHAVWKGRSVGPSTIITQGWAPVRFTTQPSWGRLQQGVM